MKVLAVLCALCVGAFATTSVCVPTPNGVQLQVFSTHNFMYATAQQYLDVASQSYRSTDLDDGTHHLQIATDLLILGAQSLTYITEGVPGKPNTFKCKVNHGPNTITDPCLTHNGTKIQTVLVGDTVTDEFTGQDDHHGVPVYSDILITPSGIPVHFTQWDQFGHTEALYMNFTTTIPSNAFAVPVICNQATPLEMPLRAYLESKGMKHVLRNLKL